jgi:hypothetical protein
MYKVTPIRRTKNLLIKGVKYARDTYIFFTSKAAEIENAAVSFLLQSSASQPVL